MQRIVEGGGNDVDVKQFIVYYILKGKYIVTIV